MNVVNIKHCNIGHSCRDQISKIMAMVQNGMNLCYNIIYFFLFQNYDFNMIRDYAPICELC